MLLLVTLIAAAPVQAPQTAGPPTGGARSIASADSRCRPSHDLRCGPSDEFRPRPSASLLPHPASDSLPRRLDGSPDWAGALTRHRPGSLPVASAGQRPRAIQLSDGYYRRLSIHRTLSFAMLPLFAGSFVTGTELIDHPNDPAGWARDLHRPLAFGTAAVFGVNTVTGIWNLIESRKVKAGRTRRWIHSLAMIAADAGFAYTGVVLSDRARRDPSLRNDHRALALGSMGLSVASWTFMLITR